MIEVYLPKDIVYNVLYPYLTYFDLVNISANISILERIQLHIQIVDQYVDTVGTLKPDYILIYSIYLDNENLRSYQTRHSIRVFDIIELEYHDRTHSLHIDIQSVICKIEDNLCLFSSPKLITAYKHFTIYKYDVARGIFT